MNKTLLAIIAVIGLGGLALYWNAQQPMPSGMAHDMTPPDTGNLAQSAPIADVVVPAELSAEAQMGQRGYEAKCASCHGTNAAGQNGIAPPLVHKTYEPNHHGDMAFVLAAKNGVQSHHWKFGNMPPVAGVTDADVMMIVRYIRELQQANGIL